MNRHLAALALVCSAASCSLVQDAANRETRNAAKSAVSEVVSSRFPNAPVEPFTDCIIDNAEAGELLAFAGDAVTGVSSETVSRVFKIAKRREALECIARDGILPYLS